MRLLAVLLVVGTGCGFKVGASGNPDAQLADSIDAPEPDAPDAPPACMDWHPRHVMPCVIGTPKPPLTITAADNPWTYDTTTQGGSLTNKNGGVLSSTLTAMQSDGSTIAVLNVEGLVVEANATLTVIGEKPLIVASWTAISIAGTIDAGSTTGEVDNTANAHLDGPVRTGAGANPTGRCGGMTGTNGMPAVATGGSGGGGGGALQGGGGDGGAGDTPANVPGGAGGLKMSTPPTVLHGGCAGGASGNVGASTGLLAPATMATRSVGGAGGGAVELTAKMSITITGAINAGGAGGAGAPQGSACGGGGGGSGGYIGVEAPTVTIMNGTLSANGGGGGGSAPFASQGNQGANATSATQAAGGATVNPPQTCGLAGAGGSSGGTLDAPDATGVDACGGGAGGGGAGFIFVWAPQLSKQDATISPAALP